MRGGFPRSPKLRPVAGHPNCDETVSGKPVWESGAETSVFRVPHRHGVPVRPDPGRTARSCPRRGREVRPYGGRRVRPLLQTGGTGAAFNRFGTGCLGRGAFVPRLPSHSRGARGVVARGSLGAVRRLPARGAENRCYGRLRVHNLASRRLPGPPAPYPLQGLRAGTQAAHDPTLPAWRREDCPVRSGSRSGSRISIGRSASTNQSETPD